MQISSPAAGIAAFGHDLLGQLAGRRPGANLVVSPASIATCFAMLRPGARGTTGEQIDTALHFAGGPDTAAVAGLRAEWACQQLSVANGVWVHDGLPVLEGYARELQDTFDAVVQRVDFGSPDAADVVNAWVRRQTEGLIDALLDQAPERTGVVLASAIHLRADWQRPFDPADTVVGPFHLSDGSDTSTRMMSTLATFEHATGDGWQAVRMPYVDCELALWVLLPDPGDDPLPLLAPRVLQRARDGARSRRLELMLPTWRQRSDLDLGHALGALGMRRPFAPGADFSALSPDVERISRVVHRAVLAVDEQGTVAAAVTGIAMRTVSMPEPGAPMVVDRPFACALVHEPTGTPLFAGVVHDPRP